MNGQQDAALSDLWASPQATQWAALSWHRIVARYALLTLAAEAELLLTVGGGRERRRGRRSDP